MAVNVKRVIIDVDVGTDDAYALMLLLHAENIGLVKIEGIICTMGNTSLANVCKNTVRLLEIFQRTDIPVYKGVLEAIIPSEQTADHFHGKDGLGDIEHKTEPNLNIISKTPAAEAMRNLVLNNPQDITVICVGPLTNLALTMKLYSDFAANIKEIFIMGGNYTARGNITETAEFNFYMDPEAAYIVLESAKCPITMVTWETCLNTQMTLGWRFGVLGAIQTPFMELMNRVERKVFANRKPDSLWYACDAQLTVAMLYPKECIVNQSSHNATVELHGSKTRGQIVLDHLKIKEPNVTVVENLNGEVIKKVLLEAVQSFDKCSCSISL